MPDGDVDEARAEREGFLERLFVRGGTEGFTTLPRRRSDDLVSQGFGELVRGVQVGLPLPDLLDVPRHAIVVLVEVRALDEPARLARLDDGEVLFLAGHRDAGEEGQAHPVPVAVAPVPDAGRAHHRSVGVRVRIRHGARLSHLRWRAMNSGGSGRGRSIVRDLTFWQSFYI